MMRKCIFCKKNLDETQFNAEHIILNSLGGCGSKDIISTVCTSCNSKLGSSVDAFFVNHPVAEYQRNHYHIKGRNGVPNYLKNEVIQYANTPIKGNLLMNQDGYLSGFRANFGMLKLDNNNILVYAPKKNAEKYAKSIMKKYNLTYMKEIKLGTPKLPHIDNVTITEDGKTDYLMHAFPLMLKMAYEFCSTRLGDDYINDAYAESIREYLVEFPKIDIIPADALLNWGNNIDNKISIKLLSENNKLYADIRILGLAFGRICVSINANKYKLQDDYLLEIDVTN